MHGGIEVRPRSIEAIEEEAAQVRAVLNLGGTGQICGWRLLDSLEDYKISGELHLDSEVVDMCCEGLTRYDEAHRTIVVAVSEETSLRLETSDARGLFTLGHEIGHAVLHHRDLIRMGAMSRDEAVLARGRSRKVYSDSEWQANTFAAELIMPHKAVADMARRYGRRLVAGDLEREFNASKAAASLRLRKLRDRGVIVK